MIAKNHTFCYILPAMALAALLLAGCSSPQQQVEPFEYLGGGGSGHLRARVYGYPLRVELRVEAIKEGSVVEACPVAHVELGLISLDGTYQDAPPLCRERFGVLGGAPKHFPKNE